MANTLELGNGKWATGKDTVLAYNDLNNNYKPLPFSFSRDSNATVVNKAGLIETVGIGEPRIDFKDDAKGALKLEPQSTNRIPNSEDSSTWGLGNITLSSLSGGLNKEYYQITCLGNTNTFSAVKNDWINLTAGTYTASVFAKKGTCDEIILTSRATHTFQDKYSVFNLTNGTVLNSQVTGSIEPYSDGWYKCSITFTNSGGYNDFASFAFGFNFNSSSTDTLFVAAPQSEISSYATSYIPTSGSAVTRVADSSSQTISSNIITQSEGTLYWNGDLNNLASYSNLISLSGSAGSWIYVLSYAGGLTFEIKSNSSTSLSFNPSGYTEGSYKIAISYSGSEAVIYINGILVHTDSSVVIPSFSTLNIGKWYGYGEAKNTKEIKLYNTRLTDNELQQLTAI